MAWSGTGEVECYGDEKNELPLIHLDDLAQIVAHVIEYRPQSKYVIAVDESNTQYGVINQVGFFILQVYSLEKTAEHGPGDCGPIGRWSSATKHI